MMSSDDPISTLTTIMSVNETGLSVTFVKLLPIEFLSEPLIGLALNRYPFRQCG